MAQPFFGRRDAEPSVLRPGTVNHPNAGAAATAHSPSVAGTSSASAAASANSAPTPFVAKEGGSTLTVGPNIKLKGLEITDCDTLVVEGMVEATMDSRLMQISERGSFKGSAEIDVAEIHGQFEGDLTVRQKLVIFATGKVVGKIRYGKLVIEEGGQISGDIQGGSSALTAARAIPMVPMAGVQRVA